MDSSIYHHTQSLSISKRLYGNDHEDVAISHNQLGIAFYYLGNLDSAIYHHTKSLSIFKHLYGTNHKYVNLAHHWLGIAFFKNGIYESALYHQKKYLSTAKQLYGNDHEGVAIAHYWLGIVFSNLDNYDSAIYHQQKYLSIFKQQYGNDHEDVAIAHNQLGIAFSNLGIYDSAIYHHIRSLSISKQLYGNDHEDVAIAHNQLGIAFYNLGIYDSATYHFNEDLSISKQLYGTYHNDVSLAHYWLGTAFFEIGIYDSAIYHLTQSLSISKRLYGNDHEDVAIAHNWLGTAFYNLGIYDSAIYHLTQSLSISRQLYGNDHKDVAIAHNWLGSVFSDIGIYESALYHQKQYLNISKQLYGNDHKDVAIAHHWLGVAFSENGIYDSAIYHFKQDLSVTEQVLGTNHTDIAIAHNRLGIAFSNRGIYDSAIYHQKQSLAILKHLHGTDHEIAGRAHSWLGKAFSNLGIYDSAIYHQKKYLSIQKEVFGISSNVIYDPLILLCDLYSSKHDYKTALNYCDTILGLDGLSEEIYFNTNINRLEYLQLTDKGYEASRMFRPITYKLLNKMTEDLSLLTSQARKNRIEQYAEHIETLKRIALRFESELRPVDKLVELDATLIGLNTRTERETRLLVYSSEDPKLIELYEIVHLKHDNHQLHGLAVRSSLNNEPNEIIKLQPSLSNRLEETNLDNYHLRSLSVKQENELLEYARKNHPELSVEQDFNVEEIQSRLGRKQACIFFSQAPLSSSNYEDSTVMLAYIINPLSIDLVTLGSLRDINQVLSNGQVLQESYNMALYNLLWLNMEPYLEKITDIFYCPTNELVSIPFHALQNERGEYLITHYDLHHLWNPIELMEDLSMHEENTSIYASGGITYDANPLEIDPAYSTSIDEGSNFLSLHRGKDRSGWSYLPGSLTEVESIAKIAGENSIPITMDIGVDASESRIREILSDKQYNVLHFATHGFYLDKGDDKYGKDLKLINADDAMNRAALLFAGANANWDKNLNLPSAADGLLTAREMSEIDMSHVDLIILSACETGNGEVEYLEGTSGFRRGLNMNGTKRMMVSLIEVPDQATKEFMTTFYSNIILHDYNYNIAFVSTQKLMLSKYPNNPRNWAGFTLIE